MHNQKEIWETYLKNHYVQSIKKIVVVTFCVVAGFGIMAHAFPTVRGFDEPRAITSSSMKTLGLQQQWRMFTATIRSTGFSKLIVTYADGSFELIQVRGEKATFSRSAENRFGETVFWNTKSSIVTSYLYANCKKYAVDGKTPVSVGMSQAIVAIPQTPGDLVVQNKPDYQVVKQVQCTK